MEKHIRNGKEVIAVMDRAKSITPFRRAARWIVWSITEQRVISEHGTRTAAVQSFECAA